MQRDLHFYATWAIGVKAGRTNALEIAWVDYQVDCCKGLGFHTQVNGVNFLWSKAGVCFHFLPGDDPERPLVTTRICKIAQRLIQRADCPISLGIALHSLQDTFSHQGFTGTCSRINSCFAWNKSWFSALIPDFGHSDMLRIPDIVTQHWTDPRTNQRIDNPIRARDACSATWHALGGVGNLPVVIEAVLHLPDYEERKRVFAKLAGNEDLRFSDIQKPFWREYGAIFKNAAKRQREYVLSQI